MAYKRVQNYSKYTYTINYTYQTLREIMKYKEPMKL